MRPDFRSETDGASSAEASSTEVTKQEFQNFWNGVSKVQSEDNEYNLKWLEELYKSIAENNKTVDYTEFETKHDWIQIFFPTKQTSKHNIKAISLNDDICTWFKENDEVMDKFKKNLRIVMELYGIKLTYEDGKASAEFISNNRSPALLLLDDDKPKSALDEGKSQSGYARSSALYWAYPFSDHNHQRLSRILTSCMELGFEEEALKIHAELQKVKNIPEDTREFWDKAIKSGDDKQQDQSKSSSAATTATSPVFNPQNASATALDKDEEVTMSMS